jgi:hypothetical protein
VANGCRNPSGAAEADGGLWHAYRRKWATERKHLPLKDVAAAGGWNDVATLLKVYQQPDPATLLVVMSEPRKVSEHISADVRKTGTGLRSKKRRTRKCMRRFK